MSRLLPFILFVFGTIVLALAQAGFVAALGEPFDFISIPMFFALFSVAVFDERFALVLVALSFAIIGLVSTSFLISLLVIGTLNLIALNELHTRFFTNRTYYSVLALGLIGWTWYVVALIAFVNIWNFFRTGSFGDVFFPSVASIGLSFFALGLFLSVAYACTVMLSKRIRSYFIISERV